MKTTTPATPYANALFRQTLEGIQAVLGEKGLQATLAAANLSQLAQDLPANDLAQAHTLAEHVRFISPGLLWILIKAEQDMLAQKTPQLTEQQLWRRVIADGGGRAGEVLADAGVPLSKM